MLQFIGSRARALITRAPVAHALWGVFFLVSATSLRAETAAVQAVSAPPLVSTGGILQMIAGLALVLGLVAAAAWALKRISSLPGTGAGLIRVVGAAAVGQRERVVLVEVGETWLLLGVAPGQVRRLHTMQKTELPVSAGASAPVDQGFAIWLRRVMEKRNHG